MLDVRRHKLRENGVAIMHHAQQSERKPVCQEEGFKETKERSRVER